MLGYVGCRDRVLGLLSGSRVQVETFFGAVGLFRILDPPNRP